MLSVDCTLVQSSVYFSLAVELATKLACLYKIIFFSPVLCTSAEAIEGVNRNSRYGRNKLKETCISVEIFRSNFKARTRMLIHVNFGSKNFFKFYIDVFNYSSMNYGTILLLRTYLSYFFLICLCNKILF